MKIICAWCHKAINEVEGEGISHGICEQCAEKVKKEVEEWHTQTKN